MRIMGTFELLQVASYRLEEALISEVLEGIGTSFWLLLGKSLKKKSILYQLVSGYDNLVCLFPKKKLLSKLR